MNLESLVFALVAVAAICWLVVRQQNLRLRQMHHRERLAALDKGHYTPPAAHPEGDPEMSSTSLNGGTSNATDWFRTTTLGLSFLLMFGGAGLLVAFIVIEDPEMRKLWSIGLIPAMAGFGLFAFWLLGVLMDRNKDD